MIPKIITNNQVTFFFENTTYSVSKTDANYSKVLDFLEKNDEAGLRLLFGVKEDKNFEIIPYLEAKIVYKKDTNSLYYNGDKLNDSIAKRIIDFFRNGKDINYLLNFLSRVKANPNPTAVEELYLFLESGNIPIMEDGCFVAYRKVDENYLSYHPNPDGTKNSNRVGETVTMERNLVDSERNRTCSRGLHFCSFSYLSQYHGGNGRIVIVKVDPMDVVSIPSDYDNSKGRCCKYVVIGEHNSEKTEAYKDVVLLKPDGSVSTEVNQEALKKFEEASKKVSKTKNNKIEDKIVALVNNKLNENNGKKALTLRQVQSSMSPLTPSLDTINRILTKNGFSITPSKKKKGLGASVVSQDLDY